MKLCLDNLNNLQNGVLERLLMFSWNQRNMFVTWNIERLINLVGQISRYILLGSREGSLFDIWSLNRNWTGQTDELSFLDHSAYFVNFVSFLKITHLSIPSHPISIHAQIQSPIYKSIYPNSFHPIPSMSRHIHPFIHLSTYPSHILPISLSLFHPPTHPSVHHSNYPPTNPRIHPLYPPTHHPLPIHPSHFYSMYFYQRKHINLY